MNVGVIIVAGGRGSRMGAARPKPLLRVGGKTLLEMSVGVFDAHPEIAQIVVVLPEELVAGAAALLPGTRRCGFVAGGPRRQDSVRNGFQALPATLDVVLVHDAARPFADRALIDRVIAAAGTHGAAVPAIVSRDTVKRVDPETTTVVETLPRQNVWRAQTPQGFRRDVLAALMEQAAGPVEVTDDAMMAERAGIPVKVVAGDERNVKITTSEDLARARGQAALMPRVGCGYDLHRLVEGRPLVLAGVTLPFDRGPLGYSDGDVLCHALTDAVLGAAGAGDIGQHFPNTDPAWKNAPGLDLLSRAVAIVRAAGFAPVSADVTVILEKPTLAPHVPILRERLAATLGISASAVSVKGKTNEGVDATGRGEAIAAHAVAVLRSEDSQ